MIDNFIAHASGTPPTRVLTVSSPQLAASRMAMQNASVKELPQELKGIMYSERLRK